MSTDNTKQTDIVRVLRVIEYTGPREAVEETVANFDSRRKVVRACGASYHYPRGDDWGVPGDS